MKQIHITPTGEVRLTLPKGKSYKQSRSLGHIQDDTFITERSLDCIMRAFGGSIGFNYELFRDGEFQHVDVYFSSGRILHTTRQTVLDYGKYLHFKHNKLEKQIYLPIAQFPMEPKAPPISNPPHATGIQSNLFDALNNSPPSTPSGNSTI